MAGRGPLPSPDAVRRNAPTIPTTSLPAAGRPGPAPDVPFGYDLGAEGSAWWAWAWRQPQACGWSDGDQYVIVRRAALEDDLAALNGVAGLDCSLLAEAAEELRFAVQRLAALATGRLALMKEMRELEDRLGLTPKGLAALRWKIVEVSGVDAAKTEAGQQYRHLQSVG